MNRPIVAVALAVAGTLWAVSASAETAAEGERTAIAAIVDRAMAEHGLRAIIVSVAIDGETIATLARGESMPGVPATPDMHFRNGAVAFSYVAMILFQLSDEGLVDLDAPIATWRPDLPHAVAITSRMLLTMTSGYADYVQDEAFLDASSDDPFRRWTADELVSIGVSKPLLFAPGTNWGYSHTGYVILGDIIEKIAGKPLADVMAKRIFTPLGLDDTAAPSTPEIPDPVLHAYSAERRAFLGIPEAKRFYEETTFWNPSWTTAPGAVQTTSIDDLIATAIAVGTGATLSPESHEAMIGPGLAGFGARTDECPTCRQLSETFNYAPGVFLSGAWIFQSPLFGGYAATEGYLPSKKIAIAVAVTFGEEGFAANGDYRGNASTDVFRDIATHLAPDEPPLTR